MEKINIVVDKNEAQISKPERPIELDTYPDLNPEIAWELANLIRIAGTDYQCFSDWFNDRQECKGFTLEEGRELEGIESNNSWIYAGKEINKTTLEKYTLLTKEESENQDITNQFSEDNYYKYRILKTYEYVAYYPAKLDVDVDRFGFIAERKEGNKKIIFIVFRGTRELGEWFSNGQFKQVNFLAENDNSQRIIDYGKISSGFNKMYNGFRPGILIDYDNINEWLRMTDVFLRRILEKIDNINIKHKSIYQAVNEYFLSPNLDNSVDVYITGHSLGGALATIAALDILRKNKLENTINLYTFASPRVGDNTFADKFNEFVSLDKIKAFRFANSEDIVPKVPFPVWFKSGRDLENNPLLELTRTTLNKITGGIFDKDYQHVGMPIYFTHQARRFNNDETLKSTATVGDNHNMTRTYCGALEKKITE